MRMILNLKMEGLGQTRGSVGAEPPSLGPGIVRVIISIDYIPYTWSAHAQIIEWDWVLTVINGTPYTRR